MTIAWDERARAKAAARRLSAPKITRRRHKMTMVFESAHNAKSFKAVFKNVFGKHESAFPGTLVFMSHEIEEGDHD